MFKSKTIRWKIAFLLCLVSGLNCLDRNAFAVLANTIKADLNWSDTDYADITAVFIFSYTLMYALSGWIVDRIGTKKGLALFAGGWSLVSMLHAFAGSIMQFALVRFFLGITESANFPAGVKASAEWFPLKERATAIGIFNAGTAVGGAVAVPVISFLAIVSGWRAAFVVTGLLGFVWLFFWIKYYYLPQKHPRISEEEKELILGDEQSRTVKEEPKQTFKLKNLLRKKETWGCFSARIFIDPVTYFILFWIPKYLQDTQGLSLSQLGVTAWLPYLTMGLGSVMGGIVPVFLITRYGWSLNKARKSVMITASLIIPLLCFFLISGVSAVMAVLIISGITLAHNLWANITIPSEIYPRNVQATITGIGGTLGGVTSVVSQKLIGASIGVYSYLPVFIYIGAAYLISFLCVSLLVGKLGIIRKID